jgi:hypothetical protein
MDLVVWCAYWTEAGVYHGLVLRMRGRRPGLRQLLAMRGGIDSEIGVGCHIPTHREVAEARKVGEVVWQRHGPAPDGADPLDFEFLIEAIEVPELVREAVAQAAAAFPDVWRVRISRTTLLKSGTPLRTGLHGLVLTDGAGRAGNLVAAVSDAMKAEWPGSNLGVVRQPRGWRRPVKATTVYRRSPP